MPNKAHLVRPLLPLVLALVTAHAAAAAGAPSGRVDGELVVNGQSARLTHAVALEVDSDTEPGYLDVVVLLSDRPVAPEIAADEEKLQEMTTEKGLIALRFVIDPDASLKSAAPYHPALTAFVSSGAFAQWQPTAFDESTVAGRISTDGVAELAGQRWRYDLTFSAPIVLDPEAETVEP